MHRRRVAYTHRRRCCREINLDRRARWKTVCRSRPGLRGHVARLGVPTRGPTDDGDAGHRLGVPVVRWTATGPWQAAARTHFVLGPRSAGRAGHLVCMGGARLCTDIFEEGMHRRRDTFGPRPAVRGPPLRGAAEVSTSVQQLYAGFSATNTHNSNRFATPDPGIDLANR